MLAAIGQGYLMKRWNDALSQHGLFGAQIMTTHGLLGNYDENKSIGQEVDDDLVSSVRNGFLTSLEYIAADPLVVPIINENDPVTPEEIKEMKHGADNDQNALLIARLTRADYLAIITNTDGVWKNPAEPKSRIDILHASNLSDEVIERMTQNGRSNSGTGGMGSKLRVMRDATHFGVGGYIYDGITSSLAEFIASKEFGTPLKGGTVIR
jgi:glutamate 5-kinase